jgi:hypothetical protein
MKRHLGLIAVGVVLVLGIGFVVVWRSRQPAPAPRPLPVAQPATPAPAAFAPVAQVAPGSDAASTPVGPAAPGTEKLPVQASSENPFANVRITFPTRRTPTPEEMASLAAHPWLKVRWLEAPPPNAVAIKRAFHRANLGPVDPPDNQIRTRIEAIAALYYVSLASPLTYAFEDDEAFYFSGGQPASPGMHIEEIEDFSAFVVVRKADGSACSIRLRPEEREPK